MNRQIVATKDGTYTIHLLNCNESYHSKHGALQEAHHVFIKNGLDNFFHNTSVNILEIGFGTGLNALVTYFYKNKNQKIFYTAIEAFPVLEEEWKKLNYFNFFDDKDLAKDIFYHLHTSNWQVKDKISEDFYITKLNMYFEDIKFENTYDIIYFDAFGYRVQPELWSEKIFKIMYKALKQNGILVTYACRSVIILAMKNARFTTKKLPGAPGKREMLCAIKT